MANFNSKQIVKAAAGIIAAVVLCTPAMANEHKGNAALQQAQQFELEGKYAVAASAYLAMAEGFDFMPENKKAPALSRSEQVLLAKCAVNCLEQGIREQLASSGNLDNCAELMMLPAACNTLMKLDPQNSGTDSMTIVRNLKAQQISSASQLR
jgi:hypothetical protein